MTTYCPWQDLDDRHPGVYVDCHDLHPARAAWIPDAAVILIDRRLRKDERRSTLAHEIAHIDLGHRPGRPSWFDKRQEREASRLAASRLVTVDALIGALLWCRDDREIAAMLQVDIPTVVTRREALTPNEVATIEARIATIEHAA